MPRLTKEQKELMEKLFILHPDWPNTKIAKKVGTTHATIRKYRLKLSSETSAIVQYDANRTTRELSESLNETINQDISFLRDTAIKILNQAIKNQDERALGKWWEKLQSNTSLRIAMTKTFTTIIDQRTQTVNINTDSDMEEIWSLLCGKCRESLTRSYARKPL